LPPNTKVKIELERSSDSFFLMVPETDKEKYKVKLRSISLFIPVAQLSSAVFNEINTILARKNDPKAFSLHFRKVEIRPITIPKGKVEFYTDTLFPDASLPCRIVVCFIATDAKIGSYHT
jgi:hypothetical protein